MVNLGKTKVMIFNGLKKVLLNYHFLFRGEEIEITNTYTYLGCNFRGPVSIYDMLFNHESTRVADP
jgi:hypothetical protein